MVFTKDSDRDSVLNASLFMLPGNSLPLIELLFFSKTIMSSLNTILQEEHVTE